MRRSTCMRAPGRSVGARFWLEGRDRDRLVRQFGATVRSCRERVGQEPLVISLGEVLAGVGTSALLTPEGGDDRRLGAIEEIADLARLEKVRVVDPSLVLDRGSGIAGTKLPDA